MLMTSLIMSPNLCFPRIWSVYDILLEENYQITQFQCQYESIFWSLPSLVPCLPEHLGCVTCLYEWELLFTRVKMNFILE